MKSIVFCMCKELIEFSKQLMGNVGNLKAMLQAMSMQKIQCLFVCVTIVLKIAACCPTRQC